MSQNRHKIKHYISCSRVHYQKSNSVVINRWSFGSFHDRRLQHRLSSLMFTGNWCVRGRLLKKTWSSVHKWIRLCTVGYIFSVRICWPEHCYILSDSSGSGSAAPSSLLLGHLLHLPLPPLHDLHPLGFVARSLLSPELVHVLEEPVPARRREHYIDKRSRTSHMSSRADRTFQHVNLKKPTKNLTFIDQQLTS